MRVLYRKQLLITKNLKLYYPDRQIITLANEFVFEIKLIILVVLLSSQIVLEKGGKFLLHNEVKPACGYEPKTPMLGNVSEPEPLSKSWSDEQNIFLRHRSGILAWT